MPAHTSVSTSVSADAPTQTSSPQVNTLSPSLSPTQLDPTQAAGVSLRAISKKYGSVTALENLTLDIPAGVYCCLLGPSGCGKTTALRLISGHETATSGQIMIGDRIVNDVPAAKRNTAMMFQNYALFPHKTIWQNVEFGLKMQQVSKAERHQRVGEMLALVGLSNTADRKPNMLSGGQQQRIALARALVTRPKVLMLDEPLSALDENLRVRMRGELRKMQKQFGLTFIQVTHHVEEAFSLSDQIVVMDRGRIEQVATPSELFTAPASQFVAKFIGDNNIFSGSIASVVAGGIEKDLIELSVEEIGSVFCRGTASTAEVSQSSSQAVSQAANTTVACCVRPDLLTLLSLERYPNNKASPAHSGSERINHLKARIIDVELTGYVTRVSLAIEIAAPAGTRIGVGTVGEEKTRGEKTLLYKSRTTDWQVSGFGLGDRVIVQWSAKDCIFLPY